MAWRGVHVSKSAHLRLEHRNLVIEFREDGKSVARLPLEDIAYLILDSLEITLSAALLAAVSENEIMVLGINDRHLPAWTSFPWGLHYRQGEVTSLQLECTLPLKKRLWQHIVERKILAQAWALDAHELRFSDTLESLASTVLSGDTSNVEARAAVIYWGEFFAPRDFQRHADDLPNILLNYGYSLVRAGLARHLCAAGFLPILGLHHCSMTNAFNLADDLIEPFRPIVDYFVKIILADRESTDVFCTDDRRALTQILESPVIVEGNEMTFFASIKLVTQSLKHALRQRDPAHLVFPQLKL